MEQKVSVQVKASDTNLTEIVSFWSPSLQPEELNSLILSEKHHQRAARYGQQGIFLFSLKTEQQSYFKFPEELQIIYAPTLFNAKGK